MGPDEGQTNRAYIPAISDIGRGNYLCDKATNTCFRLVRHRLSRLYQRPRRVNRRIPRNPGSTVPSSSALDGSGTSPAAPSLWISKQVAVVGSVVVQGS